MKIDRIIVASHGTAGALAGEAYALDLAREKAAPLHHLLVVPDFWKGMMGDDWLNNAVTRARFGDYLENQLANEAAEETSRLEKAAEQAGVKYSCEVVLGKPAECLCTSSERQEFDLAVIGSPRPKGVPGYRSRMKLEILATGLAIPLVIVPYPSSLVE